MNSLLPAPLLDPVPGDDICGVDLSFSAVFDEIREARREDDTTLAQGEWETSLKTADWPRVRELAENVLSRQSKDLQVAAWYAEAMARMKGFEGVTMGLAVVEGLLNEFWEFCYPSLDPDDLDERAGKIEWLNKQLSAVIREIPLTDRASGGYSFLKWEESRLVDNLGLKDSGARDKAIAAGKLCGEDFDKAVQLSGPAYYEKLHARIGDAVSAAGMLAARVDERFGLDAPSLKEMQETLGACESLVGKLLARLGGQVVVARGQESPLAGTERNSHAVDMAPSLSPRSVQGIIVTRSDAIQALRAAASYFRKNEPHSPVAPLAERAANWAEMPLERWLASVVKDQGTLAQLRELLDFPEDTRS
ncbi:type VI secretion system protein TssA [Propionivibrio sp.]|uniref:type VI secretion system protein TssA n=1 Tax=Propionivibrio sp. TaxID=2212460 RepID=UPI00272ED576|nr:type VI secretion system protein TssA [Propionivibrio sp.]